MHTAKPTENLCLPERHETQTFSQAFIPFSYQMPLQVAEVNALGSINILTACKDSKIKRLVHISSSEVYGPAQYVPMNEKHPLQPYSTYSVAKTAADLWAQTFFWEHKLPVVILRPFNTSTRKPTILHTRND